MFATIALIAIAGTTSLNITAWLLFATVIIDLAAWDSISDYFQAKHTGTTDSQRFWERDR